MKINLSFIYIRKLVKKLLVIIYTIDLKINKNFNLVLINSIGYKKNISLKRLIDHFHLALNLNFFLKNNKQNPDIAFIGFPPIEPAIIFSRWLVKNKIPYFLMLNSTNQILFQFE